jgi:hypothetical protein
MWKGLAAGFLLGSFIRSLIFLNTAVSNAQVLCSIADREVREKCK